MVHLNNTEFPAGKTRYLPVSAYPFLGYEPGDPRLEVSPEAGGRGPDGFSPRTPGLGSPREGSSPKVGANGFNAQSSLASCGLHILDDCLAELGALHLAGPLHLSSQVIGNCFLSDGADQTLPYALCGLTPAQVL